MKFHKRQLILASLVAALGAAVYINWQFSGNKNLGATDIIESTRELGEARYVNSTNIDSNLENSPATPTPESSTKNFFASAQSNRQKAKEESEEKLKNLISEPNINAEIKNVSKIVLKDHLEHCIVTAVKEGDGTAVNQLKTAIDRLI